MTTPAMLYDVTRCVGCHFCELACQLNKELPPDTSLQAFQDVEIGTYPDVRRAVRRHQCMHCLEPACASVCPVGALYKLETGPVVYAADRCIGCRYCMNACPFGVPKFDWNSGLMDQAEIHKCNMCADRLAEGLQPVCVEACPTGAVQFGTRDDLLAEARARLQKFPGRYVGHIYGEHEAGGTSLLLISGIPFAELNLAGVGPEPVTQVSEAVMHGTIPFALGWAAVLAGVAGVVRLRRRVAQATKEDAES